MRSKDMWIKMIGLVICVYLLLLVRNYRRFTTSIDLTIDDWRSPKTMPNALVLYTGTPEKPNGLIWNNASDVVHRKLYPQLYRTDSEATLYLFPYATALDLSRVRLLDKETYPPGFDQVQHMTIRIERGQCASIPCGWHVGSTGGSVQCAPIHKTLYDCLYAPERLAAFIDSVYSAHHDAI